MKCEMPLFDNTIKHVLIVLSGGLDSVTALFWAKNACTNVQAVSFFYGSKHNKQELEYAKQICTQNEIEHRIIDLSFIPSNFHSSLLVNGSPIPEENYDISNISSTVVPFRNGIMLSVAAGLAEDCSCDAVVLGNHSGDHAIYPDCTQNFIHGMTNAIFYGTCNHVKLLSPFCQFNKAQIIKLGETLGIDYSLTYSCYNGRKYHCGLCATCRERRQAFALAGVSDPTIYENDAK